MNKKKMQVSGLILLMSLAMFVSDVFAASTSSLRLLKIAILDNFTAEKSSWKYKNAYFTGIITAVSAAKKKGFSIEYKTFTYGNKPLDILTSIAEVNRWNPDFIIGPHSSNQFLLMPRFFKNVLVISPYATDEATTKMPSTFYSLSYPDSYMAKATVAFLEKYYPDRNLFSLAQADCKDCYDAAEIISEMYKKKYPNAKIANSYYIGNDVQNLNLSHIMSGYEPESIIILQPLSYADANVLIPRISDYLKQKNTIFIHNLDNWGNSGEAKKYVSSDGGIGYSEFRVCPLMENPKSKIYNNFISYYQETFHSASPNAVSYMTYATVISVVDALAAFPTNTSRSMRGEVLFSFQKALGKNPNWYRPKGFTYYKLEAKGEKRQEIIFEI